MIVVDASVLTQALVGDDIAIRRIADEEMHAPHLVDAEVAHALRGLVLGGHLSATLADAAVDAATEVELTRHAHVPLLSRVWSLRHNLTAYDALYVALAEGLDAPLVTGDARIAACPGLTTVVEVLPVR